MLKAKRDQDAPDVSVKLDGLTDEPRQRGVARLMTWGGIALLAAAVAIMAVRSDAGRERIARLTAPASTPAQTVAEAAKPAASDPLLVYETRRLAEQIRVLASEREALTERLASLERSLGDVTASIPRSDAQAPALTRPPVRVIPPAPPVAATAPAATTAPPVQGVPAANAPAPAPTPAAATPEAHDSAAIRTDFGVDLAGDQSIDALRSRWQQLRSQHGPILEGLRPVVAVQDGSRPGGVELRLVVGPLSNANAAARLCATLSLAGVNCKPTVFDGQRLALR